MATTEKRISTDRVLPSGKLSLEMSPVLLESLTLEPGFLGYTTSKVKHRLSESDVYTVLDFKPGKRLLDLICNVVRWLYKVMSSIHAI